MQRSVAYAIDTILNKILQFQLLLLCGDGTHISFNTDAEYVFGTKYLRLKFKVSNTEIIIHTNYIRYHNELIILSWPYFYKSLQISFISISNMLDTSPSENFESNLHVQKMLKTHCSVKSFYNISNAGYSHGYRLLRYLFD